MTVVNVSIDTKLLECSVCRDTFEDPKLLPCGHTICGPNSSNECAQKLDQRNIGEIRCPICRENHYIEVANIPSDLIRKELLVSINSLKKKPLCKEHKKEVIMRCVSDGKAICLDCLAGNYSGRKMEGLHDRKRKKLLNFWISKNQKLREIRNSVHTRKLSIKENIEYFQNQYSLEEEVWEQLNNLISRRHSLTKKLKDCSKFDPDDEDVECLEEFMNQMENISVSQKETSKNTRQRTKELIRLLDSRAATFSCGNDSSSSSDAEEPEELHRRSESPQGNRSSSRCSRSRSASSDENETVIDRRYRREASKSPVMKKIRRR